MDLSVNYMGLELKNPLIAGSSGLTGSVKKIKELADKGAGAIVLKSIFEEEIAFEYTDFVDKEAKKTGAAPKFFEYDGRLNPIEFYDYKLREDNLSKYTQLIKDSKNEVSVPVIASINCSHKSLEWISYAKRLQTAGADAIELNMFFLPSHMERTAAETEALYFQVIEKVLETLTIPVSLKISYYFTDLGPMIQRLSQTGIKGLVLFNRFFSPDFDINTFEVKPSFTLSSPSDLAISLRWMAIMSGRVDCDLAASTGVHDSEALIKHLLAGATAVQTASTLYRNGTDTIAEMLKELSSWMRTRGFSQISDFRGKMSQEKSENPALYERTQFMRYFGGKKFDKTTK
ncbi:MAG: diguanylate cyclase [Deltaproteobacteria bacterium]|nr:MAG: diguanylate cyclase [Deltaproteobacteria bacterium]